MIQVLSETCRRVRMETQYKERSQKVYVAEPTTAHGAAASLELSQGWAAPSEPYGDSTREWTQDEWDQWSANHDPNAEVARRTLHLPAFEVPNPCAWPVSEKISYPRWLWK